MRCVAFILPIGNLVKLCKVASEMDRGFRLYLHALDFRRMIGSTALGRG
jgi:hypothetical protein